MTMSEATQAASDATDHEVRDKTAAGGEMEDATAHVHPSGETSATETAGAATEEEVVAMTEGATTTDHTTALPGVHAVAQGPVKTTQTPRDRLLKRQNLSRSTTTSPRMSR